MALGLRRRWVEELVRLAWDVAEVPQTVLVWMSCCPLLMHCFPQAALESVWLALAQAQVAAVEGAVVSVQAGLSVEEAVGAVGSDWAAEESPDRVDQSTLVVDRKEDILGQVRNYQAADHSLCQTGLAVGVDRNHHSQEEGSSEVGKGIRRD